MSVAEAQKQAEAEKEMRVEKIKDMLKEFYYN